MKTAINHNTSVTLTDSIGNTYGYEYACGRQVIEEAVGLWVLYSPENKNGIRRRLAKGETAIKATTNFNKKLLNVR